MQYRILVCSKKVNSTSVDKVLVQERVIRLMYQRIEVQNCTIEKNHNLFAFKKRQPLYTPFLYLVHLTLSHLWVQVNDVHQKL